VSDDKFTTGELDRLFPDGIPMVLMKLIFPEKSKDLTIGEIRQIARSLATQHRQGGEDAMKAAAKAFLDIRHTATISMPQYTPYDAFVGGWTAALAQQPQSVPAGWQLVPITPTEAMEAAAQSTADPWCESWPVMLAVAPKPPAHEGYGCNTFINTVPGFRVGEEQPISVHEHIGQLHEWNLQTGRCTECNCHYVGFERKDPCPGSAPTVGGEE